MIAATKTPNPVPYQSAQRFAASRGWVAGSTQFSLRQLRAGIRSRSTRDSRREAAQDAFGAHVDHAEYFRFPSTLCDRVLNRASVPAAIVAHLYDGDFYSHRLWAEAYGLRAELLPHSWYAPTVIAVLYLPPEHKEKM
jgi:hypothetical protein